MFSTLLVITSAVFGILLTLLTAATMGFYFGQVPGGSNAVGLVIPFFTALGAGLFAVVASAILAARGSMDWLSFSRPATIALCIAAAAFVAVSIMGAFLAWAEKHRFNQPGLLILTGVMLPLAYFVFMILLARTSASPMKESWLARSLAGMTGVAVLAGIFTTGFLIQGQQRKMARQRAYLQEQRKEEQAEEDRINALTPEQKLIESLSKFDADAPMWSLTAGLPGEKSASLRAIWIERALRVPNLNSALRQTLTGEYGSYRHGCCVMIAEAPEPAVQQTPWATLLAQDIKLTAADIRKYRDLSRHDDDDLAQHILAITRAAARLQPTDELRQALNQLRAAVVDVAPGPESKAHLQALDATITRK